MHSPWWSFGGALFVVMGSGLSGCSNRPDELIREREASEPSGARVPDSLTRHADAETLKATLRHRLSRSGKDLPVEKTAVGTSRIDLRGRFRSVHVATVDERGKKHIDCVTSNGELDGVLKKAARR
jgi:hypothetical protein